MTIENRCVSGLHVRNREGACQKCQATRRKIWNSPDPRTAQAKFNASHADDLREAALFCSQRDRLALEAGIMQVEQTEQSRAEWSKQRQEKNRSSIRARSNNARALRIRAEGMLSDTLLDRLYKLQKGKCPCCKKPLGKDFHMDHIVPLSKGGLNIDDNIQLLRSRCNLLKSAMDPVIFMQINGFLI